MRRLVRPDRFFEQGIRQFTVMGRGDHAVKPSIPATSLISAFPCVSPGRCILRPICNGGCPIAIEVLERLSVGYTREPVFDASQKRVRLCFLVVRKGLGWTLLAGCI